MRRISWSKEQIMKRLIVGLVIAAYAVTTALPAKAVAYDLHPALVDRAEVSCRIRDDQFQPSFVAVRYITVSAPSMEPLSNNVLVPNGGGYTLTPPDQLVGFRVRIARRYPSGLFWYLPYTEWRWALAGAYYGTNQNTAWTGLTSRISGNGTHEFRINDSGEYKVFVEYYWWENQYLPSSSARGYSQGCYFG